MIQIIQCINQNKSIIIQMIGSLGHNTNKIIIDNDDYAPTILAPK